MTPSKYIHVLLQAALLSCATTMGFWIHLPWLALAGLGLAGAAVLFSGLAAAAPGAHLSNLGPVALGVATVMVCAGVILGRRNIYFWDYYNAAVAWLVAAAIWLALGRITDPVLKRPWRACLAPWTILGEAIWLAAAYLENHHGAFYLGLLIWVTLLVLCKKWFRLGALGIQSLNTLILLSFGLPLLSLLRSPANEFDLAPKLEEKPYSYEVARKDPATFARWWKYNLRESGRLFSAIYLPDKSSSRLRPNVQVTYFDSRIAINSRGFRGPEIPEAKSGAYRIVALGESTTFGFTMGREDRPWPEVLEQIIRERLKPRRPVEVINAGIPGISLKGNLERLPEQILPLHPDMIISYHGFNGFRFVYTGMPPIHGQPPPAYRQRPLQLLADCEYHLRMAAYRKQYSLKAQPHPGYVSSPLESEYARLYRQLIQIARANGICLGLATYSMAVNDQSPRDLVDFYRTTYLGVEWQIKANLAHSIILRQLALENQEVCLVDTCPTLDGRHEYFFDLVHFTREGEQQMAETVFAGLRKTLEEALGQTNAVSGERSVMRDRLQGSSKPNGE